MWPFRKRVPAIPWDDYIKTLDMPPCGDRETHYHWTIQAGNFPCPACRANERQQKEIDREDRLAEKIAKRVAHYRRTK